MITCSATTLDIIEITASQNPGDACPSFTVIVKPHLGTGQAVSTHLAWTPPSPVTFTIDDESWECVPLDAPIRIAPAEVTYSVTYYPRLMHYLRRAKLKKPAVWVSAPSWEINVYLKDLDPDKYHIFTRDADVYASNGWSVKDIFNSLGALIGYTFTANFPGYHVSQKTTMCDENTTILDFLGSLLPSGFRFVWTMQPNGVTIALLSPPPAGGVTPPKGCLSLECQIPPVEAYDAVSITGAPYKLNTGMSFDNSKMGSQSSIGMPPQEIEILPEQRGEMDGQPTRTVRNRVVQPDPFHTPFSIPLDTETVYVRTAQQTVTQTATTYENHDAVLYETPRVTKTTRTLSGLSVKAVAGLSTSPTSVLLTSKLQILAAAEYAAISGTKPTILLSAYPEWADDTETTVDEKTYITPEQASKSWPEGTETQNTQVTTCKGYVVNGRFLKRSMAVSAFLQEVSSLLQQTGAKTISSLGETTKQVEGATRSLQLQGAGAYRFEETKQTLDVVTGALHTATAMLPVNSDPPSSPTRWRTAPLTAVLDKIAAQSTLVFRAVGSVPTSNPTDFQIWATRMFVDMTQPRRVYSLAVSTFAPTGAVIGGGMVTGWACSQKGNVFSVTLTVE